MQINSSNEVHLQTHKKRHCFNRIIASINIIAHEQVVCIWRLSTHSEKLHQIVELTMHIAANSYRTLHFLYVGLFMQNLLRLNQVVDYSPMNKTIHGYPAK